MVLLRFEWHNPVSWKLKLPPPPGLHFSSRKRSHLCSSFNSFKRCCLRILIICSHASRNLRCKMKDYQSELLFINMHEGSFGVAGLASFSPRISGLTFKLYGSSGFEVCHGWQGRPLDVLGFRACHSKFLFFGFSKSYSQCS